MTTIYLSSTYEDLQDYRRVVYEALHKSGYPSQLYDFTKIRSAHQAYRNDTSTWITQTNLINRRTIQSMLFKSCQSDEFRLRSLNGEP